MRIRLSNGLIAELSESNQTAEIIESSKARGSVQVPRQIEHQSKKYLITRIGDNAFSENRTIESLSFASDSVVRSIGNKAFSHSSLRTLNIPDSLEELDDWWCFCAKNLNKIVVSPNNPHFEFVEDKFLIWKNKDIEINNRYDVLIFAKRNVSGEVSIPPNVRRIAPYAFDKCDKFHSLSFESSQTLSFSSSPQTLLKVIDYSAFCGCASLENIMAFPSSVSTVGNCCFSFDRKLTHVEFLGQKLSIGDYCFENCYSLARASFPNARKIKIGEGAFNDVFCNFEMKVPLYVEVSGEGLTDVKNKIKRISEPFEGETELNAHLRESPKSSMSSQKTSPSVKTSSRSPVASSASSSSVDKKHQKQRQARNASVKVLLERIAQLENRLSNYEDVAGFDINNYIKDDSSAKDAYHKIRSGAEKPTKEIGFADYEAISEEKPVKDDRNSGNCTINDDDEKYHKVVNKIGEGTTFVAYKVVDTRSHQVMCKKFVKMDDGKISKKGISNAVKEFAIIQKIDHPCICKPIAISTHEMFDSRLGETGQKAASSNSVSSISSKPKSGNSNSNKVVAANSNAMSSISPKHAAANSNSLNLNSDNEDDPESKPEHVSYVTAALFFEYLEISLKQYIQDNLLTNTMKAKIAVEVASGMSHIHKLGMTHKDLRIDNILLNGILEAKIIGLGLDRIALFVRKGAVREEDSHFKSFLMKDIGAFVYMSPELQKGRNYGNKTDVYSFGVVLHVLFTGKPPKLSLKEKVSGKKAEMPQPSEAISPLCIKLIELCLSFDPAKRPSFDEILEILKKNNYSLAAEVDSNIVARRHRALNRFESLHFGLNNL